MYVVVVSLVGAQYAKIQSIEERLYGKAKNRAIVQTAVSVGLGLLGGLLASILLVLVGVSVENAGLGYLLPVALVLFLFSPRFLCFSYAGALVSLSSLLFGWPKVNVAAMMALVACLHAAESLLIRLSGSSCATPLYFDGEDGGVHGGFSLQRFWPIPLIVLTVVSVPDIAAIPGLIHLPDWWPLISATPTAAPGVPIFAMVPMVAALGYGDLSLSRTPRGKAKQTSKTLSLFSIILLLFSIAASRFSGFTWVAVLFAPVGHEIVIRLGAKEEIRDEPHYKAVPDGLMVLDVMDNSPASVAGIRSGDVITAVGDIPVRTREDLDSVTRGGESFTIFLRDYSATFRRSVDVLKGSGPLGIITVPQLGDRPMASAGSAGPLGKLVRSLFRRMLA